MANETTRLKSRIVEKYGDQKTFAKALKTSPSTVCRLLKGETCWKGQTMMKTIELLEIPYDEIDAYFFDKAVSKRKPHRT